MKSRSPDPNVKHSFTPVDGFSLSSVKSLATRTKSVDWLVMTLGMATIQGFTPTNDGYDQKLQLHVYSRFLLATLLTPLLASSPDGRCISVLSAGVHKAYKNHSSDPTLKSTYSVPNAADAAGMYNDVYLEKLAVGNPTVKFSHAAPGFVNTNWGTEMPAVLRVLIRPLQAAFGKSKEKCGSAMVEGMLKAEGGKLNLVDQNGGTEKATTCKGHEEGRDEIWKHLSEAIGPFV
ncbi:hypothetical protein TrRE_jg12423 [Triparma retinervis]|uniref:Uncharacterized protein n=1 Tax=Triparma retinervis TaxID=2557542 RepID=A0A9W7AJE7_9STRA|nr:hypothetical protein TrRE_jg12423 [Triparma retinervis]